MISAILHSSVYDMFLPEGLCKGLIYRYEFLKVGKSFGERTSIKNLYSDVKRSEL